MEIINKNNRKELLGKTFFLENENSLIAKLNYIDGIDYFNDILKNTSIREIGAVIHLYKRKNGLEVRLTKHIKYFSIAFLFDEITEVSFSKELDNCFLLIKTKENISACFNFKDESKVDIVNFFNKIKINTNDSAQKVNIDNELLKIRTYDQRRMGNKEFLYIQLIMLGFGLAIGLILVAISIILKKPLITEFYNNPLFINGLLIIGQIVFGLNCWYRLRDLNLNKSLFVLIISPNVILLISWFPDYFKIESNIFLILTTMFSIMTFFWLVFFSIKKGVLKTKLGKEILI
jgi:hypothetical protein